MIMYNRYSVKFYAYGLWWSYNTPWLLEAIIFSIRKGFAPIRKIRRYGKV